MSGSTKIEEDSLKKTALIAGTTGVVGRALLEHLETAADWDIVAAEARPRVAADPEGNEITIHDAILRAKRRSGHRQ